MQGILVFQRDFKENIDEILGRIYKVKMQPEDNLNWEQASSRYFYGVGLYFQHGRSLLIDHTLPYDCALESDDIFPLDKTLMELSIEGDICVALMDTLTDTYAYTIFSNGAKIRTRFQAPNPVYWEYGDPLEFEIGYEDIEKQSVINVLSHYWGTDIKKLSASKHKEIRVYERLDE